jgi:hypothetical protein
MVTGWSHLHGELYLGREQTLGEVKDVWGLKVVLWLKGIGQWSSGSVHLLSGGHCLPGHRARMEEKDREANGEKKRE